MIVKVTRQEALTHFTTYANEVLEDYKMGFWEHLQKQSKKLEEVILEGFTKLKEQVEKAHKDEIVHFQFSFLRIDLIARQYTVLLHAYDVSWYLDEAPVMVKLDISFLFEELNKRWDKLIAEGKRYVGKINQYDILNRIFDEVKEVNGLIAHLLRFTLKDIESNADFKAIPKCELWIIRWGEYRDHSEIILQVDRYPKTQEDWEEALKLSAEKEDQLVCSYWYEGNFKGGHLKEKQLYFAVFEKCQLEDIDFSKAACLGGKFKECELKNCSFKGALLKNSDFRESHFENVDFEEADLTEAIFSDVDVPYLHLSPIQLQSIHIERS